ncbi:hypothetical protein JHK87_012071 [Glycine soja]|nr:hypothetical protein JHK87_012071 [Glycine soja]
MDHPNLQSLSIEDDEEEEMVFPNDVVTKTGLNYLLCLVGRLIMKKTIRVHIMKERMAMIHSRFKEDIKRCKEQLKQICFDSEGIARDKLVFGMLKHGCITTKDLRTVTHSLGKNPN